MPISAVSPALVTSKIRYHGRMDIDDDYDAGSDESGDDGKAGQMAREKSSKGVFNDTKAAYVLMKLKTQTESAAKGLKRRASA
jgi:hypothetical protein